MTEQGFDKRVFRNALGNFTTGVTVITAKGSDGTIAGITANSFSSVSLDPPLVLWSLDCSSPSLKVFADASHFCIHVLADFQKDLCMKFAASGDDKFEGVEFKNGLGGAPVFDNCLAKFECSNIVHHEGGDHIIIVGEVKRFDTCEGNPLIFYRGDLGYTLLSNKTR
jgi:3-hydroxy-9,10-secoandrosta-1,3,5(10)-triene-9,17-dione monooxygenase reductase component